MEIEKRDSVVVTFPTELRELRESPVPVDLWRANEVGPENNGPYKQNYQSMEVREEGGNTLVDISRYGLVSSDFYLDRMFDGSAEFKPAQDKGFLFSRALLSNHHAQRLARADAFLRSRGLFLYVRSGWRHQFVQRIALEAYSQKEGAAAASRLFAHVLPNAAPPPHATGAAFDVELVSLEHGQHIPIRAFVDGKEVFSLYRLEELARGNSADFAPRNTLGEALRNRRILFHVLCTLGVVFSRTNELFTEHPGEFWHFGNGDPLSAYLRREAYARWHQMGSSNGVKPSYFN